MNDRTTRSTVVEPIATGNKRLKLSTTVRFEASVALSCPNDIFTSHCRTSRTEIIQRIENKKDETKQAKIRARIAIDYKKSATQEQKAHHMYEYVCCREKSTETNLF